MILTIVSKGFKAWIEYALQNNPNVNIFISLAPFDFPEVDIESNRPDWDTFSTNNGFSSIQEMFNFYANNIVHNEIVDQLRINFLLKRNFTIPTGWATFNLYQMNIDSLLLDQINMFGSRENSIFTNQRTSRRYSS